MNRVSVCLYNRAISPCLRTCPPHQQYYDGGVLEFKKKYFIGLTWRLLLLCLADAEMRAFLFFAFQKGVGLLWGLAHALKRSVTGCFCDWGP